jgi:DNA polymerase/3'-5' exonuclease PolX
MFITICGSYRRGLPISSDIDILLCDINIMTAEDLIVEPDILQSYVKYLHEKKYLLDDITDKNIKTKYMGFGQLTSKSPIRRVDIRLIPMISYFPALLYFTGSYEFNQEMRSQAKKLGFKLNEYGLYDNRTDEMIVVLSELEMFSKLGMNYISPDQR